jgi:hypothetical protein
MYTIEQLLNPDTYSEIADRAEREQVRLLPGNWLVPPFLNRDKSPEEEVKPSGCTACLVATLGLFAGPLTAGRLRRMADIDSYGWSQLTPAERKTRGWAAGSWAGWSTMLELPAEVVAALSDAFELEVDTVTWTDSEWLRRWVIAEIGFTYLPKLPARFLASNTKGEPDYGLYWRVFWTAVRGLLRAYGCERDMPPAFVAGLSLTDQEWKEEYHSAGGGYDYTLTRDICVEMFSQVFPENRMLLEVVQ